MPILYYANRHILNYEVPPCSSARGQILQGNKHERMIGKFPVEEEKGVVLGTARNVLQEAGTAIALVTHTTRLWLTRQRWESPLNPT